ncbi:TMEM175 family protein [Niabella sp. CC-SYL272]|uniref:TMEM175 family protein n=1 Tax=Niabella agricola TaxID=2891571 RepID=UPI001F242E1E|nr:TMEM175 family protein [Niabella agricola]MCF3109250.1 TMEM175 family protein [Niabella agricola]
MRKDNTYNKIAGHDTGRIIAISDGVFGVALTLLVLEIRIPFMDSIRSEQDLIAAFLALKSKFLVYLLAFMTTGIFWVGHSSQYKYIEGSDRNLNWINLLFLLSVTMLPFTTAFLGDYTHFKFPIAVYWLNIFLMGTMLYINWAYACRHHFVDEKVRAVVDIPLRRRIITAQSLYLSGALLCFISPLLSIAFIILVQLNYAFAFLSQRKRGSGTAIPEEDVIP